MSMQELTDDQLDGLFRKSAEEFDTPYDPSGWDAMKDQLDDRDRAAFWKRLLPWGIPLLLLLLIGGTWYAYQKVRPTSNKVVAQQVAKKQPVSTDNSLRLPSVDKPNQQGETSSATDSGLVGKPSDKPLVESGNIAEKQPVELDMSSSKGKKLLTLPDKPEAELSRNTASDATKRPAATYREKTGKRIEPSTARTTLTTRNGLIAATRHRSRRLRTDESNLASRANKARPIGKYDFTTESRSADAPRSTNSFTKRAAKNSIGQVLFRVSDTPASVVITEPAEPAPFVFSDIAELAIRQGKWAKLPTLANREIAQPEQTESVSVPKAQPSRGFSVRFAVAPDLSSVGLTNFSRPGTNVGLFLEYRLASRWSVQAGVIRSTKVYGATADQYSSDTYGGTMPYTKPDRIDGVCNMLDIPVNVRYDIALRPRLDNRLQPSRWFVNGGVTSYVMLKEEYTFNYPPHTYNEPTQRSENTGAYGFSQLNLSVGYERALSRRLSWQVEPFIKVPLKGVGFYKVNLLSTGAFLSLRYKL